MTKKEQIGKIYNKLKIFHPLWKNGDNAYKERIEKSLGKDFEKLEELGVERHFSEALLFFGKDFVDSLKTEDQLVHDAELIFGAKSRDMTEDEKKASEIAKREGVMIYEIVKKNGKVGIRTK